MLRLILAVILAFGWGYLMYRLRLAGFLPESLSIPLAFVGGFMAVTFAFER